MMRWLLLLVLAPGLALAQGLEAMRLPGAVGLLRHASAPGYGDPAGFRLGVCETQRNLDAGGRAQAVRIGAALRAAGVKARVFSSAWCRTMETAALLDVGVVEVLPALNSFFAEAAEGPGQTRAMLRFIAAWTGGPLVLVTHQVNITALTGVVPADGELVMVRRAGEGVEVIGRDQPGRGSSR